MPKQSEIVVSLETLQNVRSKRALRWRLAELHYRVSGEALKELIIDAWLEEHFQLPPLNATSER